MNVEQLNIDQNKNKIKHLGDALNKICTVYKRLYSLHVHEQLTGFHFRFTVEVPDCH